MKVSELIMLLADLPQDAEVGYIYDGASRGDFTGAWLARSGDVCLIGNEEQNVMYDEDRPAWAPTVEQERYWSPEDARESGK